MREYNTVRETLTEIQSKYWILRGRSIVKSMVSHCVLCQRFEGKPFTAPPLQPLPDFRAQESKPFAIDFAGPCM